MLISWITRRAEFDVLSLNCWPKTGGLISEGTYIRDAKEPCSDINNFGSCKERSYSNGS